MITLKTIATMLQLSYEPGFVSTKPHVTSKIANEIRVPQVVVFSTTLRLSLPAPCMSLLSSSGWACRGPNTFRDGTVLKWYAVLVDGTGVWNHQYRSHDSAVVPSLRINKLQVGILATGSFQGDRQAS